MVPCAESNTNLPKLPGQTELPSEAPDCQQCAACCFSELARYVRVTGSDYSRLEEAAESLVYFIENRAYLRLSDGHCAALNFDVQPGHFSCRVYKHRPETCRELERGGAACLGERETKGERPLVFLGRKENNVNPGSDRTCRG